MAVEGRRTGSRIEPEVLFDDVPDVVDMGGGAGFERGIAMLEVFGLGSGWVEGFGLVG